MYFIFPATTLRNKPKRVVFNKNDPVALYNQYKILWEQLSILKNKNHAKLFCLNSTSKV
jgi:hypothetical protein